MTGMASGRTGGFGVEQEGTGVDEEFLQDDLDDEFLEDDTDDEMSPQDALVEHAGEPPDGTPWVGARERAAYERVVRPFWPLLAARLIPLVGGRYAGAEAMAHLAGAIGELADRTSSEDQEAFLDAADLPFLEVVGPLVGCCHCRHCGPARRWQRRERAVPREARLRAEFVGFLSRHLEYVAKAPNAYDRGLGMPAFAWPGKPVESETWESPDEDEAWLEAVERGPATIEVGRASDEQRRRYERIAALAWPLVTDGLRPSADGGYYWRHVQRRLEPVALHLACAAVPAADQAAFIDDIRLDPRLASAYSSDPPCRCRACRPLGPDDPARLACPIHRQDRFARRLHDVLAEAFSRQLPDDRALGMPGRAWAYPWSACG